MKIDVCYADLITDKPIFEDASKLRGYIGSIFREFTELHNHVLDKGYVYSYPKVQYKIIGGKAKIIGINEAAETVRKISSKIDKLSLGRSDYAVLAATVTQKKIEFGWSPKMRRYRFLSPWLALNNANSAIYSDLISAQDHKGAKELVNRILCGNILSMSKSLNYTVFKPIEAHTLLNEKVTKYKGVQMRAFLGEFRVNYFIPAFFGLGKGVSVGNGTIIDNVPIHREQRREAQD